MELLIVLISIEIVASKFLEAYIKNYRLDPDQPARQGFFGKILRASGVENDIWLSFFLTTLTVVFCLTLLSFFTAVSFQWLYIVTGLFTTVLNLGEAHSAYFGRENFITEKLLAHRR